MWRNSLAVVLSFAVFLFSTELPLSAQAQYPQQDPQYGYGTPPPGYGQGGPYGQPPAGSAGPGAPTQPYGTPGPADQDAGPTPADQAADQAHGVARLSIAQGDVNVRRGDTGELVSAVANSPLMTRDHLQTAPGSRAEVELDYGTLVRLAPDTDIGFADLAYGRDQLQLGGGTVIVRVLRPTSAQFEIDTPSVAVRPVGQGIIRLSVLEDSTTLISVRNGTAEISSPRGSQQLTTGSAMLVRGDPANPEFQSVAPAAFDQLDEWSQRRDASLAASQSYRYASTDMAGADDLDAYGHWVPSQYGQAWTPNSPGPNWSPYSTGHWVWADYYGWTWVDDAPWGWAPYHYGRWFWNGGAGWCWWPGGVRERSLWSPALVGFFGFGAGVAVGAALAGIGWVALAPFELFHGWWWGGGHGYGGYRGGGYQGHFGTPYGRSNLMYAYRNAGIRGGAMTAAYGAFGTHGHWSPATRGQLTAGGMFRGGMPVGPSRGSYSFGNRAAASNPRLSSVSNRTFFQRNGAWSNGGGRGENTSNRGMHVPAIGVGHSAGWAGNSGMQSAGWSGSRGAQTPAGTNRQPSSNLRGGRSGYGGGSTANGGWHSFGDPGAAGAARQSFTGREGAAVQPDRGGWHSFGNVQGERRSSYSNQGGAAAYGRTSNQSYSQSPYANRGSSSWSGASRDSRVPTGNYGGSSYSGGGRSESFHATPNRAGFGSPGASWSGGGRTGGSYNPGRSSGGGSSSFHGGGGGGSHGGGGGGGHSSGGGGSHSSGHSSGGHRGR